MWEPGGSPFILQQALIDDDRRFEEWRRRLTLFEEAQEQAVGFSRLSEYYLLRNWRQFNAQGRRLLEEAWPEPKSEFQCHDTYHKVVSIFFTALWVDDTFPRLVQEFNDHVGRTSRSEDLRPWASHLLNDVLPERLQADLIDRMQFVLDHFPSMAAALPMAFYSEANRSKIDELRIMRDDFDLLKGHALSCFELCHKALAVPVSLSNLTLRRSWDAFVGGKPVNLDAFLRLPNARKPEYLRDLPVAQAMWTQAFDRSLRNAIGHHAVRHELRTGQLLFDDGSSMPYSRFVLGVLKLIGPLHYTLHVLKMLHIMLTIGGPDNV